MLLVIAVTALPARNRVVTCTDRPWSAPEGLDDRCIALWPSHGLYYNAERERWMWQRAPVMTTVEDKLTLSYVLNYLLPMLENAGAEVYMPRERDPQIHEVVMEQHAGTTLRTHSSRRKTIEWQPAIPADGWYYVSINYGFDKKAVRDASFTVHHAGGITHFEVDQQKGFGSWIYLGRFYFEQGERVAVVMGDESEQAGVAVAPMVRFGGGVGASGERRVWECAREYLKWAGAPYEIYSPQNQDNNYRDDIRCRPRWVNWLAGGTSHNPQEEGTHIPIDMALAFHTDAGCRLNRIVGTMSIYSSTGYDARGRLTKYLPGRVNRRVNRQLANAVQQQILSDLRRSIEPEWPSRGLVDKHYNEVTYECVPSMLLELLSHQNYLDMTYGLDPRFKFTVCRAIYKGVLRHLAGPDAVVQPLPVAALCATLRQDGRVHLRWQATLDSLEPSAAPVNYIVYRRTGRGGWDNGVLVGDDHVDMDVPVGQVVSFRVAALNEGGRSMPGEAVSVYRACQPRGTAMCVNCFDRVSGPEGIFNPPLVGFPEWRDRGVGEWLNLDYIGAQTDYEYGSKWISDDAAGWGHSVNDCQFDLGTGNTHDNIFDHVLAFAVAGYDVCSCSRDAFVADSTLHCYDITDLALGDQRTTRTLPGRPAFRAFPDTLITAMEDVVYGGYNLIVSGSYVASDPFTDSLYTDGARSRLSRLLGLEWRAGNAAQLPIVRLEGRERVDWCNTPCDSSYAARSVDAFEPIGIYSSVVMRYWQNGLPAAVLCRHPGGRVLTVGFPLECILRPTAWQEIINILEQ